MSLVATRGNTTNSQMDTTRRDNDGAADDIPYSPTSPAYYPDNSEIVVEGDDILYDSDNDIDMGPSRKIEMALERKRKHSRSPEKSIARDDDSLVVKVKLYGRNAKLPFRAVSNDSAGYDLTCTREVDILPLNRGSVPTDVAMQIPNGYYGRIADRSSFARGGLHVVGGVIDR